MSLNRVAPQGVWTSRWTFVAAAAGLAIGLGNFWRFADSAGEYGGGAYLMLYVACVLLFAMPALVAEVVIGSRGRASPPRALHYLALESATTPWWRLFASLACLASLLVLGYLGVIGGWVLAYIPLLARETLTAASVELAAEHFNTLLASPQTMLYWQSLFMAMSACLVSLDMTRLLGRMLRIAVPIMLIMLALAVYCGYRLGDVGAAWQFLFELRPGDLSWQALLAALAQAFFSLSLGLGAMTVFGAYFPDGRSISRQVTAVVVLDLLVAMAAGLAIYALVLDQNIDPGRGAALLFVSLPYAFGNLFFGDIAGALFFALLGLVTLTTAVALMEPAVAALQERLRWRRPLLVLPVAALVWLLGAGCIQAFSAGPALQWLGRNPLEWLDLISANILVPLCALGFALFAGWRMRAEVLRDELHNASDRFFSLWRVLLRYIAPPAILVVLLGGLYQRFWV